MSEMSLLLSMTEIKINLILKKSNFLFLLCFKIEIIQFLPNFSHRVRDITFCRHCVSHLKLAACLLGMIMVGNKVCNSQID